MLWLAHSSTGTGSCQKIMGVGLCTYDATEKSAIETMKTQAFLPFDSFRCVDSSEFWRRSSVFENVCSIAGSVQLPRISPYDLFRVFHCFAVDSKLQSIFSQEACLELKC